MSPHDELLLRSALGDGQAAVDSWRAWISAVDLARVRGSELGLLPLVYKNLTRLSADDPYLSDLKSRYTAALYRNEIALRRSARHLEALRGAGIQPILLKGAAMAVAWYRDPGLRPMGDVDILIEPDRIEDAIRVLSEHGVTATPHPTPHVIRYFHSAHLDAEDSFTIDLHWRPIWEFGPHTPTRHLWKRANSHEIHGAAVLVPDSTDQLFYTCVHAGRSQDTPLRYLADAAWLIAHDEQIDFDELVGRAVRHRLVLPVRRTLSRIAAVSAWVPPDVATRFAELKLSRLERIQLRAEQEDHTRSVFGKMPRMLVRFMRLTEGESVIRKAIEAPSFVAYSWGLDDVTDVPREFWAKASRRVRRAVDQ